MGRKKLSDEEKQLRKWERDESLLKVIVCNCGRQHELISRFNGYYCSCGRTLIVMTTINYKNCKVLYSKENLKW